MRKMFPGEGNVLCVYIFIESCDEKETFTGGCDSDDGETITQNDSHQSLLNFTTGRINNNI